MPRQKSDKKSGPKSNMPTQRQLRVAEQVRHQLSNILHRGHFHDEALMDAGKITVTEVRISPDLKNAKAYVMPLGGKDIETLLPALNEHSHYFQSELGRVLDTKFTPKVRFVADDSFGEAARIETILYNISKTRKETEDEA